MLFAIQPHKFEMFSLEHFITIAVIIAIILILFFTRKFFIKYKYLDLAFRIILAAAIIGSEIKLRTLNPPDTYFHNLPIPLCGHLLWIASLALLSNSERIMRKIYPLCITGACLSIIVAEGIPGFPEFRFFQYFIVHGGFLIGALYFVFTRKINRFTWKDYGWSCFVIGALGAYMNVLTCLGLRDDYMILIPPAIIEPVRQALGQFGYTVVYVLVIAALMALWTLFTWLATRKRPLEVENAPKFKDYKFMDVLSSKLSRTSRAIIVFTSLIVLVYLIAIQNFNKSIPLAYVALAVNVIFYGLVIFNEILHNYEKDKKLGKFSL